MWLVYKSVKEICSEFYVKSAVISSEEEAGDKKALQIDEVDPPIVDS